MEKSLKDELRNGENVLWSAQPEAFETLDVTHKKAFITKTVLVCGIAVLLSVIYVIFALNKGIPVKYLRYEDEGHGLAKLKNKLDCYPQVADFLNEHLK